MQSFYILLKFLLANSKFLQLILQIDNFFLKELLFF